MDSLTQIVLGAACGELALGKKTGNKALLFGAIGGTIPDLDVFVGPWIYANEIDIMAFHRGFMHSIVFAVLAAFLMGWLVHKLYDSGKRKDTTTLKDWIWLFFLALFTHLILDCFTPYGTQLFLPFTDFRVAFNNISVVDPTYTIPFLLCIIIAMFFKRTKPRRRFWIKTGIYLSSFYLFLTIINKFYMDRLYRVSLEAEGIDYIRYQTQPTPLNTFLWYGIAETKQNYYVGFYSLFDTRARVLNWKKLPKNHHLLDLSDPDIQTLSWFSKGFYNVIPMEDDNTFRYNDLRYPLMNSSDPNASVFSFIIKKEDVRWNAIPFEGPPIEKRDFEEFLKRIRGI